MAPDGRGALPLAARIRQLAAHAEHRQAIAQFRDDRAADQQARVNALLLEAIDALARLLGTPGPHRPPGSLNPSQQTPRANCATSSSTTAAGTSTPNAAGS